MDMLHFPGLNCYQNCLISIAASWGLNYADAFSNLWSETDLAYDSRHDVYATQIMPVNLEKMGVRLSGLLCATQQEVGDSLRPLAAGDTLMVGMDAFFMPWSPIYQLMHGYHYFFAVQEAEGVFICFDPTYNKRKMRLSSEDICEHAYALHRVEQVMGQEFHVIPADEARAVISGHATLRAKLLADIKPGSRAQRQSALLAAKYVDALINNRYMYLHYLQHIAEDMAEQLFGESFFGSWRAVKNGLYKAALIKDNEAVLAKVEQLLGSLLDEEIAMAKKFF